jgi:hypothetical protein
MVRQGSVWVDGCCFAVVGGGMACHLKSRRIEINGFI